MTTLFRNGGWRRINGVMLMPFRFLPALALVLLAGACSSPDEPAPAAVAEERIACAVGGSADLQEVCSVERSRADGHDVLVVHHPDGAFRRFDVQADGSGLVVTDGAEAAQSRLDGGKLEVTVGADRYVFPARVDADAAS